MYTDQLTDPLFLARFSAISILVFVILGRSTREAAWKFVDFPYYLLGVLGVISFFVADSTLERKTNLQEAEHELTVDLLSSLNEDDPTVGFSSAEWISELQGKLNLFESRVSQGCDDRGYERICRIRNGYPDSSIRFGQFRETAKIGDLNHSESCDIFHLFADSYWARTFDSHECSRYEQGEATPHTNDSFVRNCGYLTSEPPSDYETDFATGTLMTLADELRKERSGGMCGSLNSFQVRLESINEWIAFERAKFEAAKREVEKGSVEQEERWWIATLKSPFFGALWPYFLIFGFSLKLAKWASSTRPST